MAASGSAAADAADLELSLTGVGVGEYAAQLRYSPPGGGAESHVVGPPLPRVRFDAGVLAALLALSHDPAAYGAALGERLFADPRLRVGVARARAAAEGLDAPLRLRLRLDAGDAAVHGLLWETLRVPAADPDGPRRGTPSCPPVSGYASPASSTPPTCDRSRGGPAARCGRWSPSPTPPTAPSGGWPR